jgi:CRISPR-associated endonuclease/helicase Cas3
LIAYAIAGHHGGLPDGKSNDSCLQTRLQKQVFPIIDPSASILNQQKPKLPFELNKNRFAFELSFFTRMIFSSLVDADFLDTERFMSREKSKARKKCFHIKAFEKKLFSYIDKIKKTDSKINKIRANILNRCIEFSEKPVGLYSLTVPTGGGKTLSSLAFAVKHAIKNNLEKIIYVLPFTTIIEQNAAVFRSILGEEFILEHHSNFESDNDDEWSRLASENWDAPLIVTTNVQFFESLYANRSSRCRKLHNMANSVVILDEVQTLPSDYLMPCIEVLRELGLHYNTTFVLCSATQPAIQKRNDFRDGLENVIEITKSPQKLAVEMKRVQINFCSKVSDRELINSLAKYRQCLCIVNTRKHAKKLYDLFEKKTNVFHLSALMCPTHRTIVLKEIRKTLKGKQPCKVISTQLIEAGVDIDFPVVFRALSGIDSIAQAAGRCNREGKLKIGQVYVFVPEEGLPLGVFRQTAQTAEMVIRQYPDDILSLAAIEEYFKNYYWLKGELLDKKKILEKIKTGQRDGDFPFKEIAEEFNLIETNSKPVIIPFDEKAKKLIDSIAFSVHPQTLSRSLQKYTVQIHQFYWNKLLDKGKMSIIKDVFPVLFDTKLYNQETGLNIWDSSDNLNPEDLII